MGTLIISGKIGSNKPLSCSTNIMNNRIVSRGRYPRRIVSPLDSILSRMYRRMRMGRIQKMLKVQGQMFCPGRKNLNFVYTEEAKLFHLVTDLVKAPL